MSLRKNCRAVTDERRSNVLARCAEVGFDVAGVDLIDGVLLLQPADLASAPDAATLRRLARMLADGREVRWVTLDLFGEQ